MIRPPPSVPTGAEWPDLYEAGVAPASSAVAWRKRLNEYYWILSHNLLTCLSFIDYIFKRCVCYQKLKKRYFFRHVPRITGHTTWSKAVFDKNGNLLPAPKGMFPAVLDQAYMERSTIMLTSGAVRREWEADKYRQCRFRCKYMWLEFSDLAIDLYPIFIIVHVHSLISSTCKYV